MARVLLITNPMAARTDPGIIRQVSRVLEKAGLTVEVAGTTKTGDAAEFARQGIRGNVDIIAVYGGDGTTMQAVRGMVGSEVPLGLIPGGTGNILAGNLRIPRSPTQAAQVLVRGTPRRIDLGCVARDDGAHYFAVNCGAGFDAELMAATSDKAKRRWGVGAYVAQAWQKLSDITSVPHCITVDGEPLEADAAWVMIANCGELIPPFMRVGENIAPDDGVLDVVVVHATGVVDSVGVVWRMMRGLPHGIENVRYARGRRITVESHPSRPIQLDGEPAGLTPFTADVLPGAIRVLVAAAG